MKKILNLIIIVLLSINSFSQEKVEPSPILWYNIEQAMEMTKENPKPIIIDVYTDWCGWCVKMMRTTFASPNIANYINTNFYPVRFDAETKDTITYKGKQYVNQGKTHDLAIELLDKRLSYPTIIFLDKTGKKFNIPGYLSVKDIEPLLIYFVENINSTASYQDFNVAYMYQHHTIYNKDLSKLTEKQQIDTTGKVEWLSFEDAIEKNKKDAQKYIVFMYVDWVYSCRTMEKITFSEPAIANLLNENFYPISFNAAEQDTIIINDKSFVSLGKGQPHQLAMALTNKQLVLPSVIFLDEKFEVINVVGGYRSSVQIESIISYFADDSYKTVKFQEYYNKFESKIK